MRRPALVVAGVVVAVVLAALLRHAGGDPASDLGLAPEPAVEVRLSGPLWQERTRVDQDGAPNVAFLTADLPLGVVARGREGATIDAIDVTLDGRRIDRRRLDCRPACPARATWMLIPPIASSAPGGHLLAVAVHARPASASTRVTLRVSVGSRLPRTVEAQPIARRRASPPMLVRLAAGERARAARLLTSPALGGLPLARRASLLAASPVALLLTLAPAPSVRRVTLRTRSGIARLTTPALEDLLVETDGGLSRIRSVEPGPLTPTVAWSEAARRGSVSATAAHAVRLVRLSDGGPAFGTYDGYVGFGPARRDWPISLVFYGHASITNVKRALRRIGVTRRGETRYAPYRLSRDRIVRFDADRGLKTRCDASGTDLHVRVYAPTGPDAFLDPEWGHVVIASAHFDRADGCGVPPKAYGYSELAERRLARMVARRLGWRVAVSRLDLGNDEPLRRDRQDASHVWLSDGRATIVRVPG